MEYGAQGCGLHVVACKCLSLSTLSHWPYGVPKCCKVFPMDYRGLGSTSGL